MELATGAMSSLLTKLAELLREEYRLQKSVKEKVQSLSIDLEYVHAALRKVAEVPHDQLDEQVAIWARDVRKASFEMEDIVDSFLVRVDGVHDHATAKRGMLKKVADLFNLKKVMDRHSIAGKIDDINKQLQVVKKRRDRYKVDDFVANPAASSSTSEDPRLSALQMVKKLFGIDEPRDAVINMLSHGEDGQGVSNKEMKIVSIVGYGGLGKTTIAKAAYDKLKVKFKYGATVFVPIGQKPVMKIVLQNILIELDKEKYKSIKQRTWEDWQLTNEILRFLNDKRYLIVIDDIWETRTWVGIKCAMPDNQLGSAIITTTRNIEVGTKVGPFYKAKELCDENSKRLFYTIIFGKEKCPDDYKSPEVRQKIIEVSGDILKKCSGVPLAIITAASVLLNKPIIEWSNVYDSIGFGDGDNIQYKNTMKILSFSYYDMPPHLQACLLYLSIFPEDVYIGKTFLIWLWIAEGFVRAKEGVGLFETGARYFNELITRGMILPVEQHETGFLNGCRVHDMVLHLIRNLSREENFISILDKEDDNSVVSRRISFQNSAEHSSPQVVRDMAHVRSVAAYGYDMLPLCNFPVLRVLAAHNCCNTQSYLKGLRSLLHLRYLSLNDSSICELPNDIGHLKLLQVLDIGQTDIEELPKGVAELRHLMCLHVSKKTRMPDWIGKVTSLQELVIWPAPDKYACFVEELGKLTELRILQTWSAGITDSLGIALLESLSKLRKIMLIELGRDHGSCYIKMCNLSFELSQHLRHLSLSDFRFSELPAWIKPSLLPNLSDLAVTVDDLGHRDMDVLGGFKELRYLHLLTRYDVDIVLTCRGGAFQNLIACTTTQPLKFLRGSMPRLQHLVCIIAVRGLKNVQRDLDLDFGLEYLPSLQKLEVILDCRYVRPAMAEQTEAGLKRAEDIHPNHPIVEIHRTNESAMMTEEVEKTIMDQIFLFVVVFYKADAIRGNIFEIRKVVGDLPVNHPRRLEVTPLMEQLDAEQRNYSLEYIRAEWNRIRGMRNSDFHLLIESSETRLTFLQRANHVNEQSAALVQKIKAVLNIHEVKSRSPIRLACVGLLAVIAIFTHFIVSRYIFA